MLKVGLMFTQTPFLFDLPKLKSKNVQNNKEENIENTPKRGNLCLT